MRKREDALGTDYMVGGFFAVAWLGFIGIYGSVRVEQTLKNLPRAEFSDFCNILALLSSLVFGLWFKLVVQTTFKLQDSANLPWHKTLSRSEILGLGATTAFILTFLLLAT